MSHETDYQRARRQRSEVKKHGITGSTPEEAARNIKKHEMAKKMAKKDAIHISVDGKHLKHHS